MIATPDGLYPDDIRQAVFALMREKVLNWKTGEGIRTQEIRPAINGNFVYEAEREVAFYSVLWGLVRDGVIVPGQPARGYQAQTVVGNLHDFREFTITPYGRAVLSHRDADPFDKNAFVADSRARLGDADERIYTYLAEANDDFLHGNYLSAAVMLGVSAELLMKWLINVFIDHVGSTKRPEFKKIRDELWMRTDKLFDKFTNAFEGHYDELQRDLMFQSSANLDLLQTLIRINRDDVGHGRPDRVDQHMIHG